jgi:hypothetical protein
MLNRRSICECSSATCERRSRLTPRDRNTSSQNRGPDTGSIQASHKKAQKAQREEITLFVLLCFLCFFVATHLSRHSSGRPEMRAEPAASSQLPLLAPGRIAAPAKVSGSFGFNSNNRLAALRVAASETSRPMPTNHGSQTRFPHDQANNLVAPSSRAIRIPISSSA